MSVRTRIAPSPTGNVHIGNIRTAIYNWLVARKMGGQFLVRIEDTDRERSTEAAVKTVFQALEWLGLDWDEEPVYQSSRRDAHLAAAESLLEQGLAYRSDFGKPEQGECIVFKMPGHDLSFKDEIKGQLTKGADDMKDLVIVRSDGNPVFHLANVLDDIHMKINFVIRGDDHIENTYRHVALYEALGAELPRFAHLPMIVNQQGKPYSKRDGDAFVGDFRDREYLSDALFNFLTLLGWNPGDDREVFSKQELVEAFDLSRVQSKPAQMDLKKLTWMNGEHMKRLPHETLRDACGEKLQAAGISFEAGYLDQVLELMGERIQFFSDIVSGASFFFGDDYPTDEKNFRKRVLKEGVDANLAALNTAFSETTAFSAEELEVALNQTAEQLECGAGKLMAPVRLAATGQAGGPSLYETLALLGRETVLGRIQRVLSNHFPLESSPS
jgi:glutamyl-tRNA synthetase